MQQIWCFRRILSVRILDVKWINIIRNKKILVRIKDQKVKNVNRIKETQKVTEKAVTTKLNLPASCKS